MDSLIQLGVFTGKAFIVVLAIAVILILFFSLLSRARQAKPLLSVENLNDKFRHMAEALRASVLEGKELKKERKEEKKRLKALKGSSETQRHVFVLDFEGDVRASRLENLREEVTAILTIAHAGRDEVVVRLESPGGMVHSYGLAAAQLVRLRNAGIQLTVCVDKVAASGGYMMACTANKILAAPFAILGSIGVVAQVPNFHRLLKKHDVDYEEITAGEFKRTISLLGEITEKGKRKFLDQIEDTHGLFKSFVATYRPQLDISRVATGEYWYGQQAKELNLADDIMASDDYLFQQRMSAKIFKIEIHSRRKWSEKLAENIALLWTESFERIIGSRLP
jgi:serine protease SohB